MNNFCQPPQRVTKEGLTALCKGAVAFRKTSRGKVALLDSEDQTIRVVEEEVFEVAMRPADWAERQAAGRAWLEFGSDGDDL